MGSGDGSEGISIPIIFSSLITVTSFEFCSVHATSRMYRPVWGGNEPSCSEVPAGNVPATTACPQFAVLSET